MKTYKNKKFYNFKEVHRGKKRTRTAKIHWKSNTWEYRRYLRQQYRTKCKIILRKKIAGEEIEFPRFRNTLWWEW